MSSNIISIRCISEIAKIAKTQNLQENCNISILQIVINQIVLSLHFTKYCINLK